MFVFEMDWNEFVLPMPVCQVLNMNSHSLTNFAVNRDHVSTIMSEVEILSLCTRFPQHSTTLSVHIEQGGHRKRQRQDDSHKDRGAARPPVGAGAAGPGATKDFSSALTGRS